MFVLHISQNRVAIQLTFRQISNPSSLVYITSSSLALLILISRGSLFVFSDAPRLFLEGWSAHLLGTTAYTFPLMFALCAKTGRSPQPQHLLL